MIILDLLLQGRIAQLVELLSYTQAVIGSSPVAPKQQNAGVVQLVRAPACHAGSCGFESRLSRMLSESIVLRAFFYLPLPLQTPFTFTKKLLIGMIRLRKPLIRSFYASSNPILLWQIFLE